MRLYSSSGYLRAILMIVMVVFTHQGRADVGQLSNPSTLVIGAAKAQERVKFPLRLVSWNVHKGDDLNWILDLQSVASRSSFVLLQEMVSSDLLRLNQALPKMRIEMVQAFTRLSGDTAGVAMGSTVKPLKTWSKLSEVTEPIVGTPKSIILAEFPIEGSQETLLVANIHAINFVGQDSFEKHCFQLFKYLMAHKGPQILAGDFNTWSTSRINFLYRSMKLMKFGRVMNKDTGFFTLDHIFVKGLKVKNTYDLNFVESSDHKPLMVDLVQ